MSDPQAVLNTRKKAMKRGWFICIVCVLIGIGAVIAAAGSVTLGTHAIILAATFGPAAIAIGYAAAQLRCPSCDVAARGILYRAKCPHCDAVINP